MLAYVFWHYPAADASRETYEERLAGFHRDLNMVLPAGFLKSVSFRIEDAAWLPAKTAYEDWYEIENFGALEELNEAATSASVKSAHDGAALHADGGAGGIYRLLYGNSNSETSAGALWLGKPRPVPYGSFLPTMREHLPEGTCIWQRQMVLGPAPEFCIAGRGDALAAISLPEEWQARQVRRRIIWPARSASGHFH